MKETKNQVTTIEILAGQDLLFTINGKPVAYLNITKRNETTNFYQYGTIQNTDDFMGSWNQVLGSVCALALEVSNPDIQSVLAAAQARFGSNL